MSRSASEVEGLRAISRSLQTLSSLEAAERPILPVVLPELRTLLRAEVTAAYAVRLVGERAHAEFVYGSGLRPDFAQTTERYLQTAPIPWGRFDPAAPDAAQQNRALCGADLEPLSDRPPAPIATELFPKVGLAQKDQLRVLVCEEGSLLAWIGAFRTEPFTAHERALLQALSEPLQLRLALERRLQQANLQRSALDAALEHLGAAAFILGPHGAVVDMNAAGRAHLQTDADVRERLGEAARGLPTEYQLTALKVRGLPDHHLAVRRTPRHSAVERARSAARRWRLTPRQSEVLGLLSEGLSNRAIATGLRCSESTVEIHVSAILAKAEVESRAALVARVWSQA